MNNTKIAAYLLPPEWQQNYLHTWCGRAAALTVVSPGMLSPRVESISIFCRDSFLGSPREMPGLWEGGNSIGWYRVMAKSLRRAGRRCGMINMRGILIRITKLECSLCSEREFVFLMDVRTWARCLVLLDCNYTIRVVYQKWWSQQRSHISYQYPGEPRLCYRGSLFITSIPTWELTYRLDWLHGRDWTLVPSSRERRFIEMSKNRGLIAQCTLK